MFATSVVFLVAYLFTGEFASSAKIGITAALAKTALYYCWERLWARIDWGANAT